MVLPLAHLVVVLAVPADPRPLPQVVADLGSPDFAVREAASDELVKAGDAFTIADFERALKDAALTPEQRLRLDEAAFRAFADSPHAAIGVRFGPGSNALVENVTDGFPAAAVLKPGDVITKIDGQTVSSRVSADGMWSTVRPMIVSHDPGDKVPIVVQRDGAAVALTLPLGDFRNLGPTATITSTELRAAWQHRQWRGRGEAANGAAASNLIDASMLRMRSGGGGYDDNGRPVDLVEQAARQRAAAGESPSVVAGAQPDRARQATKFDDGQSRGNGLDRFNNGWGGGWGGGGLVIPPDPRELSRKSETELTNDRVRLSQQLQFYISVAEAQRGAGGGGRGAGRQFFELINQTQRQLDAVINELDKRKLAKQNANLPPAQPAPEVDPQAKPDQNAGKP